MWDKQVGPAGAPVGSKKTNKWDGGIKEIAESLKIWDGGIKCPCGRGKRALADAGALLQHISSTGFKDYAADGTKDKDKYISFHPTWTSYTRLFQEYWGKYPEGTKDKGEWEIDGLDEAGDEEGQESWEDEEVVRGSGGRVSENAAEDKAWDAVGHTVQEWGGAEVDKSPEECHVVGGQEWRAEEEDEGHDQLEGEADALSAEGEETLSRYVHLDSLQDLVRSWTEETLNRFVQEALDNTENATVPGEDRLALRAGSGKGEGRGKGWGKGNYKGWGNPFPRPFPKWERLGPWGKKNKGCGKGKGWGNKGKGWGGKGRGNK
jgi:hypothetical protein